MKNYFSLPRAPLMTLVVISLLCAACGTDSQKTVVGSKSTTVTYHHDASWPIELDQFSWGMNGILTLESLKTSTAGVGVDRDKKLVYVLVRSAPNVRVFREDGTFVRAWSPENAVNVHMLHVGPKGNVWIADNKAHTVTQYTPTGKPLLSLGTYAEPGMDGTHFNEPTDIATTADGQFIFVSDGYENRRVAKFDNTGKYLGMWGSAEAGTGDDEFTLPHSITVLNEKVYVADRSSNRVQVFDLDGRFIEDWANAVNPWGLANFNGAIFVAGMKYTEGQSLFREPTPESQEKLPTPTRQDVMIFSAEGDVIDTLSLPQGRLFGQVDWVHGIDVGADGDLYLADVGGNHIQKWTRIVSK